MNFFAIFIACGGGWSMCLNLWFFMQLSADWRVIKKIICRCPYNFSHKCIKKNCYSPLTFEKSKSFLSIDDGDGKILSGPLRTCDAANCCSRCCWLTPLLLCELSLVWWFNFSLGGNGDCGIFTCGELTSPPESLIVWMLGVLVIDRAPTAAAISEMGLRRLLSLCCRLWLLPPAGDPDCSFFGVFGLVNAKACVCCCKIEIKKDF